jgi:putative methionine-R-sulfoxide reductase with GAF domain
MALDRHKLHADLNSIVLTRCDRHVALKRVAVILRTSGNYRWVGLHDVDRAAGQVAIIVWSGPSAPEYPVFPTTKGLTGTAIAERKTVNVGHVNTDPRYLTAFGTTKSEIIIPIFDIKKENVIGTIDVESEYLNAFDEEMQIVLEACADIIQPLWQR